METVSAVEILRQAGADKPVKEGTFLQRTGFQLAVGVGALAATISILLVVKWICYVPALPTIPPDMDRGRAQLVVEMHHELQRVALEPFTTLFDIIVVKVLFPIFATILGYIFGTQAANRSNRSVK